MSTPRMGRPRSEESRRAILEATRDLLLEGGYERLAIGAIAARAGVGKQTIYRWWSSKASIVADAVIAGVIAFDPVQIPSTGDLRSDLETWMRGVVETSTTSPHYVDLTLALTAATSGDSRAGEGLYTALYASDREVVLARLRSAKDASQVRPDVDLEAVVDALFGSLLIRTLNRIPASATSTDAMIDLLFLGLQPQVDTQDRPAVNR